MTESPQAEIASLLRLAFGQTVPVTPVPVPPDRCEDTQAFALHGADLPPRVLLRRYPAAQQSHAWRAFTALRALHCRDFPVPEVYYLGWSQHTRQLVLLHDYPQGRGQEGQPPAFFARVGPDFARTLAALHALDWDAPPDLPVLPLRYVFEALASQVDDLETPELRAIRDWLAPQAARMRELPRTMLHGNYTLRSVWASRTRIGAVLDWEHAAWGDPRFDVGHTSAALSLYGAAFSDQFMEAYDDAAGAAVPDSAFWEVFGALRLLARLALSLAAFSPPEQDQAQEEIWPAWEGLLSFVAQRSGLDL